MCCPHNLGLFIYGMYCRGNTQFTGAEVTFSNCKYDLLVANSNSKMTGGALHLSGNYFGAQFTFDFEMTGGVIDGSVKTLGIVASQGTTTLKGGTINLTASYPFYLTNGSTVDFAGANVTGKSTSNSGLYVDSKTDGNSYKISGGTVVLTSSQAGANELYTSIPSNYGVWAGADEAGATLVDTPTKDILIASKYVRFAEKKAVTLTLVNVKEGTSASDLPGTAFTYTAKDAPSGQHFSHWELTVGSTTTNVGTDTTYSGRMPISDATLTAVFENHSYTEAVAESQYLKTEATCTEAAVYYKSCSGCGASSQGTAFEDTFSHGEPLKHLWSDWTSNGGDTHSRVCSRNANHTETEACSGGTATCQEKAVCAFCHKEYGKLGDHSYTAEVAEERYLKDAATCTEAAVYYKSCSVCGVSSKDTASEATFSYGNPLEHQWGAWTSDGNDTHSRICSRDENHKETRAHDFSAETAESQYLKSVATSTEAAVYYKSCSVCGASSKGTAFEATFSHGGPLGNVDVPYLYCDENGANWQTGKKLASEYTRVTTSNTSWGTSGKTTWYVVQDTVTIDSRVTVSGDVRLILTDGCTLTVTGGIQVQDNSTESTPNTNALTIYAQSVPVMNADGTVADGNKAGRLTAQIMEETDAAIGGNENGDGGTITINGGIVDAEGKYYGAGIGGGCNSTLLEGGSGGTITINGGFVKAAGNAGAAIGGGCYGAGGGTITINGGIVKAESLAGAGIGGGLGCNGGIVTITGGIVTASCGESAGAGIGAGIGSEGQNQNYNNSSTFRTQEADAATNGNAVIFASSLIGDQRGKYSWHGVIFEGALGKVYGTSVTLTEDFTIDSNMDLLILEGETLTIATDVTAVNNGRVFVDGNLIGTVSGTGPVYYHLTVTGATATPTFNYINKTYVKAGETVTLTVTNIPEGQVLDGWTTSDSAVTVENNAFTMPDKALTVTARIKTIGTVSIDDPSKVYDSQPVSMDGKYTVNGTGTVTVEYKVKDAEDVTYTQIAPTDAGSYIVRISVAASDNYTAAFATQDFTITKAAQDAPKAPTVKSKTYNSVTLETIPDNANGAAAQYSMDGGATWQDSPGFTDLTPSTAYRFVARYRETDNYFASPVSTELSVTTSAAPSSGGSSTPTYAPTVTQPENGTVTVSPKSPKKGDTVTITPKSEAGYTVEQILVTDKNGDPVEVTNNGDGTYSFTQPAGKVDIAVTFMEDNTMLSFFVDVPADTYYYDAVLWAAKKGITGGVDNTHFAPNAPCTRAQAVTFLWRAAGCPAPKSSEMPFTDVVKGSYYETAVQWAVENGITNGTSDTTFSPDTTCSRAQIVSFLWRSQGTTVADAVNPFKDVAAGAYYDNAVLWAVGNGITTGTGNTTFSPDADCTRAQIMTFLFRFFVK